ncbi:MAG: hypothetical protein ABEK50_00030, partial [bacterium]
LLSSTDRFNMIGLMLLVLVLVVLVLGGLFLLPESLLARLTPGGNDLNPARANEIHDPEALREIA